MRRFSLSLTFGSLVILSAVLAAPGSGCGGDIYLGNRPDSGGPCPEFRVGSDLSNVDFGVSASIKGDFEVAAQAVSDLAAVLASNTRELTLACKNIAVALDPASADLAAANALTGIDAATKWCDLASTQINTSFLAGGKYAAAGGLTLTPDANPWVGCRLSIPVWSACRARCDGGAACDLKANPPTCVGGQLTIACNGGCTPVTSAAITCKGSCSGLCSGDCQAQDGGIVECVGRCDGICGAKAGVGDGTGAHADGTCQGTCSGTCTATMAAPRVACSGLCVGTCDTTCRGTSANPAQCDGRCDADVVPLTCNGALGGACMVTPVCQAACDATAAIQPECTPAPIALTPRSDVSGALKIPFDAAILALRTNLPEIFRVPKTLGRIEMFTGLMSALTAVPVDKLGTHGAACLVAVAVELQRSATDFVTLSSAAERVAGAVP